MARHGGPSTAPPHRDWTICRWFQFSCVIRSPSACKSSRSGRVTRGLGYLLHVCTRIARHRSTRASIRTRGKEVGRKSQSHTTWKHRRAERDPAAAGHRTTHPHTDLEITTAATAARTCLYQRAIILLLLLLSASPTSYSHHRALGYRKPQAMNVPFLPRDANFPPHP